MIEDEPEVLRQEVDLTIDHGPLSDDERCSLQAFLVYLFREFLFPDQSKGRAHLLVIDWTPMRVDPIPPVYAVSSRTFRTTTHLISMFLVMSYFPCRVRHQFGLPQSSFDITPPRTSIIVSIADKDVYMREMSPWMEEWRDRIAHVISEEEEESISLSLYEEI
ncbi:hypothetical protein AMTR_s00004p00269090 [Amborella trichopoda]|uniref:Uncharacterized protein n=1 Tax=Amborella trichopoda TaxID=13333 RepID=W1NEG3_AMBTC|nr:hypothetical protein AMTR_s00004p00269090 [Amborella trichopoda]